MRCSKCGNENPAGKKFCEDCGAPLAIPCPKCGAETTAGKRFCGECGAPLDATAPTAEPRDGGPTGERRHLTVLFCDLVGSTEMAAQLDPEEWREMVGTYHRAAAEAITLYGGHVAHYLGDGVMAYFGWPEAHENDAERAARAGLAILEAVSQLNEKPTNPKMSVRIGIDSGAVVVGPGAGKDADVFGETPNIAARVQTAATANTVLITGATHRLLSGLFVVEERGAHELKGVANPVELYRILRPTGVRGRLSAARGFTQFVGREEELRLLLSRWERACDGEGQHVLVVGEAGIGKSRLMAEFHDRIRDTPHIWIEGGGEQFFQNSPFHAVSEMLSHWLQLETGSKVDDRMDHLERILAAAALKPEEAAPLIADLLQLPVGERYPAIALTPEQKRRRLLVALRGWVFGAARSQPVVMAVEDLHWLDPSSLELVQLLVEQAVMAPLTLMCTARPEFHPQWPMRSHHTRITLNRLSARNVREMVAQVAARNALNSQSVDAVIERTGGNPLFVEELTRAVLENGNVSARAIPVTLHDSLMARLDRLGSAKSVLQLGSVIGGEFSHELLRAVHRGSELELESELRKLADADLLYFRGIPPDATYQFKHALIRDAAYEALLKSRRKELHRLVARTIDEKFPDLKQTHPDVLALHWTEAGETESAIVEWSRAGEAAEERNAFLEALESFQQAVSLIPVLPESPTRDLHEFKLRQSIYTMVYVAKGLAAPEAIEAIDRVSALAEKTGNLLEYATYLSSRGFSAFFAGDLQTARIFADQIFALGTREHSATMLAHAHFLGLVTCQWSGDLEGAEKHFETGLGFFSDAGFRRNPGTAVAAIASATMTAWALGRCDLARKREGQMMETVNANSPYEVASAHVYAANLRVLLREYAHAESLAAQALAISEKHQLGYLTQYSRCILGQARSQIGSIGESIALLREGIAGYMDRGLRLRIGYFTAAMAEAQKREGNLRDALETVELALKTNHVEMFYRPEIFRLRGEIRVKLDEFTQGDSDFREAIGLARKIGAKAWELRATMSLAHLLAQQGRRDDARTMLTDIYNWFTEGFDTADLKDAKALLDELSVN
jgi:class 3 adenylate cyclase/tetratricopeptide (TPR) repeat protein